MQRRAALLVAMMVAPSCSSMRVHSELAPRVDLGQYRTYGWASTPERPEANLDQNVRLALRRQLAQRGLTETTESPDFLIAYHVLREQKVAVADWGSGIYGWAPDVINYTEGAL